MRAHSHGTRPCRTIFRGMVLYFALASTQGTIVPSAVAEVTAAPVSGGRLVKVVMLSRHGVRSPIPSQSELDSWTQSQWPVWQCDGKVCEPGQLTPRGRLLAEQMGAYYRSSFSALFAADGCPTASELFVWADVTERTRETGLALLRGLHPSCDISMYFHTASPAVHDRIFHQVKHGGPCRLDAARAEAEMRSRVGGDLSSVVKALERELTIAQQTLQCCQPRLCAAASSACQRPPPAPDACTLAKRLPSCLVHRPASETPSQVVLGGGLRTASTFAELLLLEYANGFPMTDVGWGRITRDQLTQVFRLHTTAFDIEQRTPYVAALQGSALLEKILGALADEAVGTPGSAPPGASFVAYVGHDTNIANVAAMLSLSWQQPGYQEDQTPPAGALVFELRQTNAGARNIEIFYIAQSLDDMRAAQGNRAMRARVRVPDCDREGSACPLAEFAKLVREKLDRSCTQ